MIMVERNDYEFIPPGYAYFADDVDAVDDSIGPPFIPYGLGTHNSGGSESGSEESSPGDGDGEYLRCTAQLAGVVVATLAGVFERFASYNGHYVPLRLRDHPDVFAGVIDTMRMYQWPKLTLTWEKDGERHYYSHDVEAELLTCDPYTGVRFGAITSFGSRVLDALCGDVDPPFNGIRAGGDWSPNLPYVVSDAAVWNLVWPEFDWVAVDTVFCPLLPVYSRRSPCQILPLHDDYTLVGYRFGLDFHQGWEALNVALHSMALPCSMQDVLAYETGMDTADFAHWRNGSTRLDWKRLGIACQMERQAEIVYDLLHMPSMTMCDASVRRVRPFSAQIDLGAVAVSANGLSVPLSGASWTVGDDVASCTMKRSTDEWSHGRPDSVSYVTARAEAPTLSMGVGGGIDLSGAEVFIDAGMIENFINEQDNMPVSPVEGPVHFSILVSSIGELPDAARVRVYMNVKGVRIGQTEMSIAGSDLLAGTIDLSAMTTLSAVAHIGVTYQRDGRLCYSSLDDDPVDRENAMQSLVTGADPVAWGNQRVASQKQYMLMACFGTAEAPPASDLAPFIDSRAENFMNWDAVKGLGSDPERRFCALCDDQVAKTEAVSKNLQFNRLRILENRARDRLRRQVGTCYTFAPPLPSIVFSLNNIATLDALRDGTTLTGTWAFVPRYPIADVEVDAIGATDPQTGIHHYSISSIDDSPAVGYELDIGYVDAALSEERRDAPDDGKRARFDGYAETTSKILWRHENFRDPDI